MRNSLLINCILLFSIISHNFIRSFHSLGLMVFCQHSWNLSYTNLMEQDAFAKNGLNRTFRKVSKQSSRFIQLDMLIFSHQSIKLCLPVICYHFEIITWFYAYIVDIHLLILHTFHKAVCEFHSANLVGTKIERSNPNHQSLIWAVSKLLFRNGIWDDSDTKSFVQRCQLALECFLLESLPDNAVVVHFMKKSSYEVGNINVRSIEEST